MIGKQKNHNFYIFDYFLDGAFLKWEEVNCQCPVPGQRWIVRLEDGSEIATQVVEIEPISEDEQQVFLCSQEG